MARKEAVARSGRRQHGGSDDDAAKMAQGWHRTQRGKAGGEDDGGRAPSTVAQSMAEGRSAGGKEMAFEARGKGEGE